MNPIWFHANIRTLHIAIQFTYWLSVKDTSSGATSALLSFLDDISKNKADIHQKRFLANIVKNIAPLSSLLDMRQINIGKTYNGTVHVHKISFESEWEDSRNKAFIHSIQSNWNLLCLHEDLSIQLSHYSNYKHAI